MPYVYNPTTEALEWREGPDTGGPIRVVSGAPPAPAPAAPPAATFGENPPTAPTPQPAGAAGGSGLQLPAGYQADISGRNPGMMFRGDPSIDANWAPIPGYANIAGTALDPTVANGLQRPGGGSGSLRRGAPPSTGASPYGNPASTLGGYIQDPNAPSGSLYNPNGDPNNPTTFRQITPDELKAHQNDALMELYTKMLQAGADQAEIQNALQRAKQQSDIAIAQQTANQTGAYQTGLLGNQATANTNTAAYQGGLLGIQQEQNRLARDQYQSNLMANPRNFVESLLSGAYNGGQAQTPEAVAGQLQNSAFDRSLMGGQAAPMGAREAMMGAPANPLTGLMRGSNRTDQPMGEGGMDMAPGQQGPMRFGAPMDSTGPVSQQNPDGSGWRNPLYNFIAGRHIDPRQGLAWQQSNSPNIGLISSRASFSGQDPNAFWGDFQQALPQGRLAAPTRMF